MLHVKEDWATLWNVLVNDVHPPLYYIILKIIMSIFGYNLQVAKIVSLMPIFILNIYIINKALKSEKSVNIQKDVLLILFLLVSNLTSNYLYIGLEVRMYSWASFFVTMSGIYAYKLYNEISKKNIAIFIIMGLGAALTHYYALIMEIVIYLLLFILLLIKNKKNIKYVLIISFFTVLGYLWWVPIGIKQFFKTQKYYWIKFEPKDILNYIKDIIGLKMNKYVILIMLLFVAIVIVNVIYKLVKKKYKKEEKKNIIFSIYCIILPFIIIFTGTLFNIFLEPIFVSRYMLPSVTLFWIGIINLLNYIDYKKTFTFIFSIITICLATRGYIKGYRNEMKTGTSKIVQYINQNVSQNDILASNINHLNWTVLEYYFPNNKIKEEKNIELNQNNIIWLLEDFDTTLNKEIYEKEGYNVEYIFEGNFDNQYYFKLYKIYR